MNGGVEICRALVNPRDEDEEEVCDGGVLVNARFVLLEYMSEGGVHIYNPPQRKEGGMGVEEHPEAREDRKSGRSSWRFFRCSFMRVVASCWRFICGRFVCDF